MLLLLGNNISAAEPNDETLRILADDVRGSIDGGAFVSGNVELTRGSMSLQADTMSLQVEEGSVKGIEAKGTPVRLQLTLDDGEKQEEIRAEASTVIFGVAENQIEFEGNARVESEEISITGDKIRLDVDENQFEAESVDPDKQVEVILRNIEVEANPTNE
ncbi:MAG: lipopolysaccharide transport periplasmic protein LptA [Gammaproteobacteria bacterium]|nr:lipopolysaccharide transport periplasmic protein LptA [Gammaproteobacteria bacterium]